MCMLLPNLSIYFCIDYAMRRLVFNIIKYMNSDDLSQVMARMDLARIWLGCTHFIQVNVTPDNGLQFDFQIPI